MVGQTVEQGDVLAFIDSREVGEAKLRLAKDQLHLATARRTSEWYKTIHDNSTALLEALDSGQTLDDIEVAFRDRPVGKYRQQRTNTSTRTTARQGRPGDRFHPGGSDQPLPHYW